MKNLLTLFLLLSLLGFGCNVAQDIPHTEESSNVEPQIYVQFVQNVHDFVFPDKSIKTLHRLIDLHEQYELPVEMYLTDSVLQKYLELDPDLVERLKSSPYVAVSYHVRPPHPIQSGFDTVGLRKMNDQERYETLLAYEEHELDTVTGGYTDAPGGYQLMKDTIGYAPRIVGLTNGPLGKTYSQVLEEKGALFTVLHEGGSLIEDTVHGLNKRPEDTEVKLYEYQLRDYDIESLFKEWTESFDGSRDFFVNLKFHENNYYTTGTPFGPIYWEEFKTKEGPYEPPYDLSLSSFVGFKSETIQDEKWDIYEQALEYVANNSDWLTAINAADLEQMLEK